MLNNEQSRQRRSINVFLADNIECDLISYFASLKLRGNHKRTDETNLSVNAALKLHLIIAQCFLKVSF